MAAGDVTIKGHSGRAMRGKKIVWGTVQLDGSNPTPIALAAYLTSIDSFAWSHVTSSAPGDDPTYFTHAISTTTVNLYAWKNTGGTDPTLVASTDNAAVISFIAIGTP